MPTDLPPSKSQSNHDSDKTIANSRKIATIFVAAAAIMVLTTAVQTKSVGVWIFFGLLVVLAVAMYFWAFRKKPPQQ